MEPNRWIILGVIACLRVAVGADVLTTSQINALYVYRSPLHDQPPAPGAPLGFALAQRVVFVLVDALRDDTSHDPAVMPFLNGLRAQGAWAAVHSGLPSYSEPPVGRYAALDTRQFF
jgi:hypothetical protein